MISSTILMVSGLLLLVPQRRPALAEPDDALREAFIAPTQEPVPADMMILAQRIHAPLRLVGGSDTEWDR